MKQKYQRKVFRDNKNNSLSTIENYVKSEYLFNTQNFTVNGSNTIKNDSLSFSADNFYF